MVPRSDAHNVTVMHLHRALRVAEEAHSFLFKAWFGSATSRSPVDEPNLDAALDVSALPGIAVDLRPIFG